MNMTQTRAKVLKAVAAKFPTLFSEMYIHFLEEGESWDNSILFSMVMTNMAVPGTYWMPENIDQKELFTTITTEFAKAQNK